VLVAVVPTVAIFLVLARDQRHVLVDQAAGGATRIAQLVAERHQRNVDAARGLLLAVSRMRAVAALDAPGCSASLAPLLALEPVFVNVGAARPDGTVFCSAAPLPGRVSVADRAYHQEALRSGGLGVGEYVVSRIRGTGALGFGYPVEREPGRTVAVAFASLATERLQAELDALELPPGTEVAVVDRAGVTVTARPDPARWAGKPFAPELLSRVGAAGGPVTLDGPDRVRRIYDLRPVTAPDGTVAIRVLAGIPLGAVVDPVNRLTTRAVTWTLVVLAGALAFSFLVAELVLVRRLRRIAEASRAIAGGDLAARTGVTSPDEIGALAARFDDMARALEALEREKRQREEELRQAQKVEVVGQLAGGIAHDFNNLLTVVLSAGTALRERLGASDEAQQDLREILDAAERAATLTRQLLAFSRRHRVEPRVVDVCETVTRLERMLRRVLGGEIELRMELRGPSLVHADPSQLELAILNLAVNARDAMPGGGVLAVEVRPIASDSRPDGDDMPAGPLVRIAVRDTGHGIDAETQARMFEPFFTTKRAGRGTGLGLPIVKGVVADCGGALRVRSEVGKGTEFDLYFPARAATQRETPAPAAAPSRRGTETILVVEDDPHLRGVVRRTLTEHGYAVRTVGTATDARALEGAPPDLIFADVILPDGNGIDLARELVERWPGAGVLFTSGYAGEHLDAVGTLPPGAELLPKPFAADALLARVREVLERRRGFAA
jgi:signal transduction histidine kinase